jgi:glutaredoxin-related protein
MGVRSVIKRALFGRGSAVAEPALARKSAEEQHASDLIEATVARAPAVVFLRGTVQRPADDASAEMAATLRALGLGDIECVDANRHDELWQCMKDYASTPEFPILFIGGDVVGGVERVRAAGRESLAAKLAAARQA